MSFTVGLFGDVMLGRRVGRALARKGPDEVWAPEVRELTADCDFVLANLECCVSRGGRRTERIPGKKYFFRGPPEGIGTLEAIRVSAVSLANNHALDFEEEAFADTLSHLRSAGIAAVGAGQRSEVARRGVVLTRNGHRLGVICAGDQPVSYAATDSAPGIAFVRRGLETPKWLIEEIARLRDQCDRVVAFMHWGPNMTTAPARWQQVMAAELQAAGADLVAGHSAHVFHGIAWTSGGPVLFDLGDALDDYRVMDRRLRNELGLFARWRPGDSESALELIGLRLEHCFTGIASGADADWIADRLDVLCGEFGVNVERIDESVFRVHAATPAAELPATPRQVWPQPKSQRGGRRVLWTADDVIEITSGKRLGADVSWAATELSYRTSTVRPGHLFAITKTPYVDGYVDAPEAVERGAVALLTSRVPEGLPDGTPIVLVDNIQRALSRLATAARDRSAAKAVAVTGSFGKTSVTEALRFVLRRQAPTYCCRINENDDQGGAVSVARLPDDVEYGVFELCIVQRRLRMGGVARKSRWVRPQVAVVTGIGRPHRAFYDTVENIADAKAGIFHGVREGGAAIIPRDDAHFERLEQRARRYGIERIVTFGAHPAADVRLDDLNLTASGSEVFATVHGLELDFAINLLGRHHAMNSLAVLAAVEALGADAEKAAVSLSGLREVRGRGRRHVVERADGSFEILDHSFNASSMESAIEVLGSVPVADGGRRVAVLGDMPVRADAERLHVELALELLAQDVDLVFTAGEATLALREALPADRRGAHAESGEDLAPLVVAGVRPGDTVLVKGRGGLHLVRVVKALIDSAKAQT